MDDTVCEAVATGCPGLRVLALSHSRRITDKGIIALGKGLPLLLKLRLDGCTKIRSAAIQFLVEHCPLLQLLDLSGCKHITAKTVKAAAGSLRYGCVATAFTGVAPHPHRRLLYEQQQRHKIETAAALKIQSVGKGWYVRHRLRQRVTRRREYHAVAWAGVIITSAVR